MADQADTVLEMAVVTTDKWGRPSWVDISTDLQKYVAMSNLLRERRVDVDAGHQISWEVQYRHEDQAKHVGLYNVDDLDHKDTMVTATIPWRNTLSGWALDTHLIDMNRDPGKVVDLLKTKRHSAITAMAAKMETGFWRGPTAGTDDLTPYGLNGYWLDRDTTKGFNGGNHPNFTGGPAGLTVATYAQWNHFTFQYTNVTKADLVKKMREAMDKCLWESPDPAPIQSGAPDYTISMDLTTKLGLEDLAELQNDRIGRDIAFFDGKTLFRGIPIQWVPEFENAGATANKWPITAWESPVVGIDWTTTKICVLRGWNMKVTPPHRKPDQHNVIQEFFDLSWNLKIMDRRRLWLGSK